MKIIEQDIKWYNEGQDKIEARFKNPNRIESAAGSATNEIAARIALIVKLRKIKHRGGTIAIDLLNNQTQWRDLDLPLIDLE